MKTSEVLKAARKVIESPGRWTTGAMARNIQTDRVVPLQTAQFLDAEENKYCALGAIQYVLLTDNYSRLAETSAKDALERALPRSEHDNVGDYNDNRTHRTILRLFDRAIAMAQEEEEAHAE